MTVKKKILLSNISVLVIPIIGSLLVGIMILQTVGSRYWFSLEKMYQDDNGVYSAQSLLYAYSDELSAYNWLHYDEVSGEESESAEGHEEGDSDYLKQTATMKDLENELHSMGYHFIIIAENEARYSNLYDTERDIISRYTRGDYAKMEHFIIKDDDASIIKNTFISGGSSYEMIAIGLGERIPANSRSYIQRYVTTFIVVFLISVFCLFALVTYLLSRSLGKAILCPLKKLKEGTEEIKLGHLDFEIDYNKKDEFKDICTAFNEMRIHLKESVDSRLKYEAYRKEMIAGISHDLRTPLTSIKGYAEGLKDGIANTVEKRNRYYDAILTRALDMQQLVDNLSAFSRLENNNFKYDFVKTDMKTYIRDFIANYGIKTKDKNLALCMDCRAKHTTVSIDQLEMQRVFVNLFENAMKYCETCSPTVKISIHNEDYALIIDVQDNGKGVNEKDLDNIFMSFYRGEKSRTNAGSGSGLGLSIVKQIVEGHSGSVTAKNNNGLCICIRLPLLREDS